MLTLLKTLRLRAVVKDKKGITYYFTQPLGKEHVLDLDFCVRYSWCFFKLFDFLFKHFGFIKNIFGRMISVSSKFAYVHIDNYRKYSTTHFTFFSKDKVFDSYDEFMYESLKSLLAHNKNLAIRYPFRGEYPEDVRRNFNMPDTKSSPCLNMYLYSLEIRFLISYNKKRKPIRVRRRRKNNQKK